MIELPWSDGMLRVPVPSGWRMLGTFRPPCIRPEADPETLCKLALANPVGAPPLGQRDLRGKRILLVVDDLSRPTPVDRFFGSVRKALVAAGAEESNIEVLFGLGVHRAMTAQKAAAKIGEENLARHRWHNHNCFDDKESILLGTTSRGTEVKLHRLLTQFDLLVLLGAIEPHLLLGFSGGYKMLLPGCAHARTVGQNHLQGNSDERFNYVGAAPEASPMRLDLEEGAALLGKDVFQINAVLNADGEVVRLFCGDPCAAFRAGADLVRGLAEISLSEMADVVIANSRPFDADLRQGLKCLGNTMYAARPGGLLLGFFYCKSGLGDQPYPPWTLPYPILRSLLHILGCRNAVKISDWIQRKPIEERFLTHFGLRMLHRNHLWFFSENLEPATGKRLGLLRQFATVEAMMAAAVKQVGPNASVAIVPEGGATYAPERRCRCVPNQAKSG